MSVRMLKLENSWTDFIVVWYEYYAPGGHPTFLPFNFPLLVKITWRVSELVRWERN
jgi:hypothetical protein